MNLTGTFRTTRFSDLLRYYSISKDSATVRVWLDPAKKDPDGIFEFVSGQLIEASLEGAQGKDAIRRALTLREGSFAAGGRDPIESEDLDFAVEEVIADLPPPPPPGMALTPLMNPLPAATAARPAEVKPAPPRSVASRPAMAPTLIMDAAVAGSPSPVGAVPAAPPALRGEGTPGHGTALSAASALRAQVAPAPVAAPPMASVPRAEATPTAVAAVRAEPALIETAPSEALPVPPEPSPEPFAAERGRSRRRLVILSAAAVVAVAAVAAVVVGAGERLVPAPPVRSAEQGAASAAPAQAASTPAVAKTAVAKTAAPRGVLPDSLVLGMVSSFTGSNKERGRAMRIGWEMAIAGVNESGGINGRKVRLVSQDDGYDPRRTLAGMKAVIDEGSAFAIVGNVGTATAAVAIPYAAQRDAVFFGALSGADLLRKVPPDRHVFNFRASLGREGEAAVRYLVDVRRTKPQRIAVLAQDDEFGASGRDGALRQLNAYGVSAGQVLQLSYPRNTTDVREALAELRAKRGNVDAVVMVATYKPAATLVRKARDAGLGFFFTTVSADSNGLAEELVEAGPAYTRGVLVTQVVPVPLSHATTLVRYRQELEKHTPGEKPGSTSLEAWLGAQIFLEGVRRAGRDLDSGRLIAALESIRDWDLGIGGNITFGPDDHQGCDVVWGWLLQPDGTYRQVDLE